MYTKAYGTSFDVIGIATRASSDNLSNIQKLWQRFFKENIIEQISNKADHAIIALYFDYNNNYTSEYTYLIGVRVPSNTFTNNFLLNGLVVKHVPEGNFALFTTNSGPVVEVLYKEWQKIWLLEDNKHLNRVYKIDYEVYDQRSHDANNAQVDIYVAI